MSYRPPVPRAPRTILAALGPQATDPAYWDPVIQALRIALQRSQFARVPPPPDEPPRLQLDPLGRYAAAVKALGVQGHCICPSCDQGELQLEPGEIETRCPRCRFWVQLTEPYRPAMLAHLATDNARLRAGIAGLRRGHGTYVAYTSESAGATLIRPYCPLVWSKVEWLAQHTQGGEADYICRCGATEWNARLDALLQGAD